MLDNNDHVDILSYVDAVRNITKVSHFKNESHDENGSMLTQQSFWQSKPYWYSKSQFNEFMYNKHNYVTSESNSPMLCGTGYPIDYILQLIKIYIIFIILLYANY